MTALALIWLIVDMLLAGYAGWGRGPNIGRGLIIFACYFLIAGGVALVALYGGFRIRRWNLWSWVAAAVIASMAVGFVSVRIIKPRDLEAGQVGRLGVTVSDAGDPVLVFAVCRGRIDHVRISGPYRGGPNELFARYESNGPVRDEVVLDVTNPGAGWAAAPAMGRDVLAREGLVIASAFGEKASLSTVSFSADDVASLARVKSWTVRDNSSSPGRWPTSGLRRAQMVPEGASRLGSRGSAVPGILIYVDRIKPPASHEGNAGPH